MEASVAAQSSAHGLINARTGRGAEILLGLVFLVSALLKVAAINLFIVQIYRYGVPGFFYPAAAAVLVLIFEVAWGVLLVVGARHRFWTLGTAALALLFYTGLILYGWLRLGLEDCGCTGEIPMHPVVGIAKNVVLLGLVYVAWKGLRQGGPAAPASPRLRRWAIGASRLAVALILGLGTAAYALTQVESVQPEIMGERPFAAFRIWTEGGVVDLGEGEYFVALLSTTCIHCKRAIPKLNDLAERPDMPAIVAICRGTPKLYHDFIAQTGPQIPLTTAGIRSFYSLIGFGMPRYVLVRDGRVVEVWDYRLPPAVEIRRAAGR
jgi:thiol-disulfide isomerase/thioredoxin